MELVALSLEYVWDRTITWMGRRGGRQWGLRSGVLSGVLVTRCGLKRVKMDGDLDESRHGRFGGDGIVKCESTLALVRTAQRRSTDVA